MADPEPIYLDYSTISTFQSCKEKARLNYVKGYRSTIEKPSLAFGAAFHTAVAIYLRSHDLDRAQRAFLKAAKRRGDVLPISADDEEKRSLERGLALLSHYVTKYQNEPFEVMKRPDTGETYTEIGFAVHIMDWRDRPVMYIGKIDSIKRSRTDGRPYNFELKTTGQGLSQFLLQVRPNHQISGYHMGATLLGIDIAGTYWDAVFISDRKIGGKFPDGIDPDKDFGRSVTQRSKIDIEEFLFDFTSEAKTYLSWCDSQAVRWPRSAPTACHMYGGCEYREACGHNLAPAIMTSKFKIQKWEPWVWKSDELREIEKELDAEVVQ